MADEEKKKNIVHLMEGQIATDLADKGAMGPEIPFEKGTIYPTRGGWPALVIWIKPVNGHMWAIHQPGTEYESIPIAHNAFNGAAMPAFSINIAPTYRGHPADIMLTKVAKI